MAEVWAEYMAAALEATRGTAVTPPTHYANLQGMMSPTEEWYRPSESRGTLEQSYRSKKVRAGTEWSLEGGLDLSLAPFLLNMVVKGNVTAPTTPTNGILTRLWSFVPTITSDDLESATFYFGDPNEQIFQAAYAMAQEMTITSDPSGTDGVTMSINGIAQPWTTVSPPTMPAQIVGDLVTPSEIQLWLDTSSAIGTTEVTGRVVSASHTIPTGITVKHLGKGPGSNLGFTRTGRTKRQITTTFVVEFDTLTEYNYWLNQTVVKCRIRHNGPQIEAVTPTYYQYLEVDTYGPLSSFAWAELEGSNRTLGFTILSEYDATLGASFRVAVQNTRTAL
jgi:hypothetical protein